MKFICIKNVAFVVIFLLYMPMTTQAYDTEINGIYYNLIGTEAEVTFGNSKYKGTIIIPETIAYNDKTYSVTSIGEQAFCECDNLTSLTIPGSVTAIGNEAFDGCLMLETMICYAEEPPTVEGFFFFTYNSTLYVQGKSVAKYKNHSIWGHAFSRISSIPIATNVDIDGIYYDISDDGAEVVKVDPHINHDIILNDDGEVVMVNSVVIPDDITYNGQTYKVTSIREDAFFGSDITSLTIGNNVTSIGERTFEHCESLTSVTIGNSVTSIGEYAFAGCSKLTSITMPNSILSIGSWAFKGCSGLTSITIPSSVTSIAVYAFMQCCGLTSIVVEEGNTTYDSREDCNAIIETATNTLITGCAETIIPNSVTRIGHFAFEYCTGLISITIPDGVTSIDDFAFGGCKGLTSITISGSVTSIGNRVIEDCSSLASIVVAETNTVYDSREGCNAIIETATNTLLYGCMNTTIPNTVTSIGGAFWGCINLSSLIIPESVTAIGEDAFNHCDALTSITIPESVTSIGSSAFWGCKSLTTVIIPSSVTSIGHWAFRDCDNLTSVIVKRKEPIAIEKLTFTNRANSTLYVPYGCKTAYKSASFWQEFKEIIEMPEDKDYIIFADNNVKALCIANWDINDDGELSKTEAAAVTDLGEVFKSNKDILSFEELQYFSGLTSIREYAFYGCSALASVTLPETVTNIGKYAFSRCEVLASITIPERVTNIGNCVFYKSPLRNVLVKCLTPPSYDGDNNLFDQKTFIHGTLYVPVGTWNSYAWADGWYEIINIRETSLIEEHLSQKQAYTLMNAKTFTYTIYDPINDRISTVPSFGNIDENNPNHCWQVIGVNGRHYLYCIGAKKFAIPSSDDTFRLTSDVTSISMEDGKDGIVMGGQVESQWAFIRNEILNADDAIADIIKQVKDEDIKAKSDWLDLSGRILSEPQRGINIIRYQDGSTKKILVK